MYANAKASVAWDDGNEKLSADPTIMAPISIAGRGRATSVLNTYSEMIAPRLTIIEGRKNQWSFSSSRKKRNNAMTSHTPPHVPTAEKNDAS